MARPAKDPTEGFKALLAEAKREEDDLRELELAKDALLAERALIEQPDGRRDMAKAASRRGVHHEDDDQAIDIDLRRIADALAKVEGEMRGAKLAQRQIVEDRKRELVTIKSHLIGRAEAASEREIDSVESIAVATRSSEQVTGERREAWSLVGEAARMENRDYPHEGPPPDYASVWVPLNKLRCGDPAEVSDAAPFYAGGGKRRQWEGWQAEQAARDVPSAPATREQRERDFGGGEPLLVEG